MTIDECKDCHKVTEITARGLCKSCTDSRKDKPKAWSQLHPECLDCGRTDRPHAAKGRCKVCDERYKYHSQPVQLPEVRWLERDIFKIDRTGIPKALRERLERESQ